MPRTYLITGASGIGAETAKELARVTRTRGEVQIFFSSLTAEPCVGLQRELHSLGAAAEYLVGDLTSGSFPDDLLRTCIERFGRLDGLFNVAGISGRKFGDGPVHQCTDLGWNKTLETNLTTQFRMCRGAVAAMLKQESHNGQRGVILNMSSILALHPEPMHFDTIAYATSKGAVISMSRSMAASYVQVGIRVNAIAPALVDTAMSARASQSPEVLAFLRNKQPLSGGAIAVADIASTCAFLLTNASCAITGQLIEVDAGWGVT